MSERLQYGWYSQGQYDAGAGSNVYMAEDDREVFITQVTDGPAHGTAWSDIHFVGMVKHWLRHAGIVSPSMPPLQFIQFQPHPSIRYKA